ncbi:MFS transporter [Bifidobacterium catulorum]|uniref:MFS transporter n=1 Tax=Bifidobacterium catulorum TaxID=1630173 RepID=A0A2U2MPW1_9BIFI|nr:MFS transporter [Bifidobacterium catulorum]PWG58883.1 MFS transporter [Bifidobacterium catulorum]
MQDHAALLKRKRFIIMVLLFLCGLINYLDRSALSISASHITAEFGLSSGQLGIIFSAFSVGYAMFNVVGGFASDKFGPRDTLLVAAIVWSLFSGALIFATGFISILIIRIIFGMAEGPLATTMNKTVDMWYPDDQKTTMISIANCGAPLGAALSGPIVGYIALHMGWRWGFVAITVIGLTWAFIWWRSVNRVPPKVDEGEKKSAAVEELSHTKIRVTMKRAFYFKTPSIIFAALAFFAYNYILFFFLTWFPSYLESELNVPLETVSLLNMVPWTLGCVGIALGGIVSDRITVSREWKDELTPKRLIIGVGLLISGCAVLLISQLHNLPVIMVLVGVAVFFMYFTGGLYWGVINNVVDSKSVGSIGGVMHAVGNCAGILGPSITGFAVQLTGGSFVAAFMIAGVVGMVGAVGALLCIRKPKVTQSDLDRYAVGGATMDQVFAK